MKLRGVVILFYLAIATCGAAVASVPPIINYQGKLLQPSGAPVPDSTYQMQFAIYDVPTGGTALWSETNPSVQVKGGLFAVLLGSINNLPANVFDNQNRWFGVKVGSDLEMTPRQQVASVAFAVKANSADVAASVPDGTITTSKIAAGAIVASKLATGAVGNEAIEDGAVTSSSVADAAITGTKLSMSAIKLGYAQIISAQGGISAQADLAGLSVTVTVPPGGRSVKITGCGLFDSAGIGNKSELFIYEGGTQLQHSAIYNSSAVAGGSTQSLLCIAVVTPSPGGHTYRLRASASIGSALVADSSRPAFILVELI